jgi:signal transduction histidine kinase
MPDSTPLLRPPPLLTGRRRAEPGKLGPPRLLKSAGFRFAVLFAAMFASAAIALVAVLWWATAGALDRQTDVAIRADAVALSERWREAGPNAVAESIEERLSVDVENEAIYLLMDAGGAVRLAGNIDRWPPEAEDKGWFRTLVRHDGFEVEARLHRVDLPGLRLLVGRDETEREMLRRLLTEGVIWASGAVILFALLGAWLLRSVLQARLRPAFRTAAAIGGGDLGSRIALSGREDEFDRLAQTMNAMLDHIGTLMSGVRGVSDAIAHDLRTPIARARAKLEDAVGAARGEAALRRAIEEGIADLDNISRIFRALLRIAEAEAGARRAAFAPFDLVPVLRDAAELYEASAEAREQRLEIDLPARLAMVGDRDLLLQAVANLLDNAIKFTPPGGEIRLYARQEEEMLTIAVSDDGPGLSPEDRAHAGERFFRADRARATPGSGLGLSLVVAVAHLHGGEIRLGDAKPGGQPPGLRAALRIPAA